MVGAEVVDLTKEEGSVVIKGDKSKKYKVEKKLIPKLKNVNDFPDVAYISPKVRVGGPKNKYIESVDKRIMEFKKSRSEHMSKRMAMWMEKKEVAAFSSKFTKSRHQEPISFHTWAKKMEEENNSLEYMKYLKANNMGRRLLL